MDKNAIDVCASCEAQRDPDGRCFDAEYCPDVQRGTGSITDPELCCGRCGKAGYDVEERYSFGVYAGKLCPSCCSSFRDNCGLDQPQGNPADLDEPMDPDAEVYGG